MKIDTTISRQSWNNLSPKQATSYLHNYPASNKHALATYIKTHHSAPKIFDIGCGNAQLFTIVKKYTNTFEYQGVEGASVLAEEAEKIVKEDGVVVHANIFDYLPSLSLKFDFSILCHMLECTESVEFLIAQAQRLSRHICIEWYDYPDYEYDSVFIGKTPVPGDGFNPFVRRKMSPRYWEYIKECYGLKLIHGHQRTHQSRLEIYSW